MRKLYLLIILSILLLSGCNQQPTKYLCQDGKTYAYNTGECPKTNDIVKTSCPFSCCPSIGSDDSRRYFDRPCPDGQYCCNNICKFVGEEC